MPAITVWKCPETGEYHEDEKLPIILQRPRFEKPKRVERHVEETVRRMPNHCADLDDVTNFVYEHWAAFHERGLDHVPADKEYSVVQRPELQSFRFVTTQFGEISSSRHAPFGKPTNWGGRDPDLPKWYLGYTGRMEIILTSDPGYSVQNIFHNTALKVGPALEKEGLSKTGGHVTQFMAYLFLEDWKALAEQAAIERLMGSNQLIEKYYEER